MFWKPEFESCSINAQGYKQRPKGNLQEAKQVVTVWHSLVSINVPI